MRMSRIAIPIYLAMLTTTAALAALPPDRINFEGVLRNASNAPQSGTFDMVFRLHSADTGGDEILIDSHTAAGTGAVTVTGGLFNTELGGGVVTDGSGPGSYPTLTELFRDYSNVYLSIQIGAETLSPRIKVVSAGHALNSEHASKLDNLDSTQLLRSDATATYSAGTLSTAGGTTLDVNGALELPTTGITGAGIGSGLNADLLDGSSSSAFAQTVHTHATLTAGSGVSGVSYNGGTAATFALGNLTSDWTQAGAFDVILSSASSELRIRESVGAAFFGTLDVGDLSADQTYTFSGTGGTVFTMGNDGPGSGMSADTLDGIDSLSFLRSDVADTATGVITFTGDPTGAGVSQGSIYVNPSTALANETLLGVSDNGTARFRIDKEGDADLAGNLAVGNNATVGANTATNSRILVNSASGISAVEGYAENAGVSGGIVYGVIGSATASGAGNTKTTYGVYGTASGGLIDYGVYGTGTDTGVYGTGYRGVYGFSADFGVVGESTGYTGVVGNGLTVGGYFVDSDSSAFVNVATSTFKIQGTGSVAFVQNHPSARDKVIVYNAPEGDEVATYTRGSARLQGGVAHVTLGETFAWVTNPDIGLTASVTPRGRDASLYVESVTPSELVVRGSDGASDAAFDYIVYGLRIGFEEVSIVQEKQRESRIPSMTDHRQRYVDHPELRQYDALERFKKMRVDAGDTSPLDLARSKALHDAIEEFDPKMHKIEEPLRGAAPHEPEGPLAQAGAASITAPSAPSARRGADEAAPESQAPSPSVASQPTDSDGNLYGRSLRTNLPGLAQYLPASGPVAVGDVLVVDRDDPTRVRVADSPADAGVVGIATGEPGVAFKGGMAPIAAADPELAAQLAAAQAKGDKAEAARAWRELLTKFQETNAPVALSGILVCKADAGPGAIHVGDLLVSSKNPGHAMRADSPAAGTVIAKALQNLDEGTGLIRVLVMPR